jgi:hypothetical protein
MDETASKALPKTGSGINWDFDNLEDPKLSFPQSAKDG